MNRTGPRNKCGVTVCELFYSLLLAFIFFLFSISPAFAAAKIEEVPLSNGAKAWLIEDHSLPIITLRLDFSDSGTAYDPKGKEGLAMFAMRMLTEGAGDMDALHFNRALDSHAIRLTTDANEDFTTVKLETLSEFKKDAFAILADAINKPRFDNDAIERSRAERLSWLTQAQTNPLYIASLKWKELAFANHPYHQAKYGSLESLKSITREDLQQFMAKEFACGDITISVAGDTTPDAIKGLLATALPTQKCSGPAPLAVVLPADSNAPTLIKNPVPQTIVQASFPGVLRNDPHYYALVMLNQIFGGGTLTARLGEEIRIKRGLAYYAESDVETLEHSAYLGIHFATRNEEAQNAVKVFFDEVDKIRDKGVTQKELDDAKSYITGSFPLSLDSESALVEYMSSMQRYKLGIDYLSKRNDKMNAVTLNEVNTLAKSIFSHKPIVVMVGQ